MRITLDTNQLVRTDVAELVYAELRRIFFTQLIEEMEMIQLGEIPAICSDPEDDKVIATAVLGGVGLFSDG